MSLSWEPLPKALVHLSSRHSLKGIYFNQLLYNMFWSLRNIAVNVLKMTFFDFLEKVVFMPSPKGVIAL